MAPDPYTASLSLPQTPFSLRANAAVREPEIQAFWEEARFVREADKFPIAKALSKVLPVAPRYDGNRFFTVKGEASRMQM